MSKKGTYNRSFFGNFSSRLHGTPVCFGLLLGQPVQHSLGDVLFAAATPRPEDGAPLNLGALLKSSVGGVSFLDWATQHAAAVRKLLPAGLEPLGCFLVASEAQAKEVAATLVPLLRSFPEALVLSIDPSTRKSSFWQLAAGAKPALRPAEMKAESYKDYLLLWSVVHVDVLLLDITDASRAAAESLKSCVAAVGDEVVDMKGEALLPKEGHELQVSFLRPGSVLEAGEGALRLRCVLACSALLLRRNACLLRDAVAMLQEEVASSVAERVRLALEESEKPGDVQLPWRALFCPQDLQLPVWLGDYCMPDEEHPAARERLGQLLGLQENSLEQAPAHLDEYNILAANHAGTYRAEDKQPEAVQVSTVSTTSKTAVCLAALVLLLALCIPKLW